MPTIGTRSRSTAPNNTQSNRHIDQSLNRDPGLSKSATGTFTFAASPTSEVQGSNGTFANFVVKDVVIVLGSNLNNSVFIVTGIDSTNQAYLVLSPPPETETINCTVRTQ